MIQTRKSMFGPITISTCRSSVHDIFDLPYKHLLDVTCFRSHSVPSSRFDCVQYPQNLPTGTGSLIRTYQAPDRPGQKNCLNISRSCYSLPKFFVFSGCCTRRAGCSRASWRLVVGGSSRPQIAMSMFLLGNQSAPFFRSSQTRLKSPTASATQLLSLI